MLTCMKTKTRQLSLLVMCIVIITNFQSVTADWGDDDEDCVNHHGITRQYARYIAEPNITLDGVGNETVWHREDVYKYIVVVGSKNTSEDYYINYLHVQWIFDDTYLYLLVGWQDDTYDLPINSFDLFMLCWNINCENYTVGMYLESDSMLTDRKSVV